MKKLLTIMMAAALLAGCSSKSNDTYSLEAGKKNFTDALMNGTIELGMMAEFDDETLEMVYGIKADQVDAYYVSMAMMNVHCEEVAIFEVSNETQKEAVKTAIDNRLAALNATWEHYLADQYEKVKNATVLEDENTIILIVSGYNEEIQKMMESK